VGFGFGAYVPFMEVDASDRRKHGGTGRPNSKEKDRPSLPALATGAFADAGQRHAKKAQRAALLKRGDGDESDADPLTAQAAGALTLPESKSTPLLTSPISVGAVVASALR
jgi:hypothetical protein